MGSRRVGLARTQALIEQLKRELQMGGTTFVAANVEGAANASTALTPGSGLQSGSVTAPKVRVANVNGAIITTIQLDLQGLSGSSSPAQVIGNAEARDGAGASPCYLYQHLNAVNGILYKAEMSCLETIAGGAANNNFCISGSEVALEEHGDTVAGSAYLAFSGSYLTANSTVIDNFVNSSDESYMYLTSNTAGAVTPAQFSAGKLVIRLYGYEDFT